MPPSMRSTRDRRAFTATRGTAPAPKNAVPSAVLRTDRRTAAPQKAVRMPARIPHVFVISLLGACLLFVLGACAAEPKLYLRIRNSGELAFEHVWQGSPRAGSDHDFGRIEPEQTSEWHAFPAVLSHYRKTRLQPDQGRQLIDVIDPMRWVGQAELPPGHYTLDYALHAGGLRMRLVRSTGTD